MGAPLLTKVLVPLDGSAPAEAVLALLRRMLPRQDCRLLLFHAIPFAPGANDRDAEQYLRKVSFHLTHEGYPSNYLIRLGSPAPSILDVAAQEQASLVALSTHGRSGAARWILGSVAERVLQASTVPVLVERSFPPDTSRGRPDSPRMRNILVPLDGSRHSLGVLEPVLTLARPLDAHVTLLHVTEPSPYEGRWDSPTDAMKEADHSLREACIPSRIVHRTGDPGGEILKAATEEPADLIAMTTHGRSGPSRWVFGSVTAKVLRSAPMPLLVVRQSADTSGENHPPRGESLIPSPIPE